LTATDRTPRFILVLAAWALALVLGSELAGLFENPTVTIGVIGGLLLSAMYLARPLQNLVQRGRSVVFAFRRLFPLPRTVVAESSIYSCIIGITVIMPALVFVAFWFPVSIPYFRGSGFIGVMAASSQPIILARAKAGHE
jgi:hypothetical protein